ncbi:MAG TPA: DUF1330 domain-containing protein [Pseudonocardia sp.]|jgi:uncharacterized protein (DUF1330 family)|nr:DUF1330 domain-containing protein [Pseudonocardia sp.]
MTVDPTPSDVERFLDREPNEPVVMLNLLRFGEHGREAYLRYAEAVTPLVEELGGRVVYAGDVTAPLVESEGQAWDAMILVSYPSRSALIQMVQSSEYQAVAHLRRDALTSTLLAPVTPWQR